MQFEFSGIYVRDLNAISMQLGPEQEVQLTRKVVKGSFPKLFHSLSGFLERGLLVKDTGQLSKKYMKSVAFYVDCVSIIPTQV